VRLLAVLLVLVATVPTRAQAEPTTLDALAQRSDAIVLGRCVATHSHWDDHARVIVTDSTLAVERSFKGDAPTTIEVRTLGGQVGAVGMGLSHAATFALGTRAVAFVRHSRFGPYFVISSAEGATLPVTDVAGAAHATLNNTVIDLDDLADRLESTAR
jgi:hypothetical protein